MDTEKFDAFVKSRYNKETTWYDKKAIWNHRAYRFCTWGITILAAITPILIILEGEYFKWIAVAVAALVAILNGAVKSFKYYENWISYRTTCETLRKEKSFFDAGVQGYDDANDKEALFVERVESLISRENSLWVRTHEKTEETDRR